MQKNIDKKSSLKKWGSLVILGLALAIIIIDTTLLNVSFASILKDLNTTIQKLQWVITAYSLTLAALTITGGRLGDLLGRKKMFMLGAFIFAMGSLIASYSKSIGSLIAGESIIEGIGGALMMPATASLLVANFKGKERAIAFGVWGGIAAASSAIGPVLGGYLATNYSWRWGFRINVFVAAILLLGSVLIKESRDQEEKPSLDWFGVILSSTGLFSLVFGLIEASKYGWFYAKENFVAFGHVLNFANLSVTPIAVFLGLLILSLFLLWENHVCSKGQTPLVSLKLFNNRQFTSGAVTTMVMALSQAGLIFSIPIFLQGVRGLDSFHTGLTLIPSAITALIVAPLSAILVSKISAKRLIQIGFVFIFIGILLMRKVLNVDTEPRDLILPFAIFGIGIGLNMAQINNLTLSAVSVEEAGEASGVNNTLRQIGMTLGSAIIGTILISALTRNFNEGINSSTIIPEQQKSFIKEQASNQMTNVEFGGGPKINSNIPQKISEEIRNIANTGTTNANKEALAFGALFVFMGILTSMSLPNVKNLEQNKSAAANE